MVESNKYNEMICIFYVVQSDKFIYIELISINAKY